MPNAGTRRGRRPRHRKGSLPDAVVYVLIKKIIRLFLRALSADASS